MSPVVKKKRKKITITSQQLLLVLTAVCAFLLIFTFNTNVFEGVLKQAAGYVVVPFQNGIATIGGYLSDGFNYVIAGSVIIKNAAGLTVLVLIFMRFIPVLISLIMLSLSLKLVAAVAEPLKVSCAVRMLKKTEAGISLVRAAVTGTTFLTIIFVGAVMLCGSSVI